MKIGRWTLTPGFGEHSEHMEELENGRKLVSAYYTATEADGNQLELLREVWLDAEGVRLRIRWWDMDPIEIPRPRVKGDEWNPDAKPHTKWRDFGGMTYQLIGDDLDIEKYLAR